MQKKKITILKFIPMIVMMVIIFVFSQMPGDDSAATSGFFLEAVEKFAESITHEGLSEETIETIHFLIRKFAHFTEYAVFGATIMLAIWQLWKNHKLPLILPELIAAVYAASDEFHQYFISGRYSSARDVLIDSCGAFTGIIIYYLIWKSHIDKQNQHLNA